MQRAKTLEEQEGRTCFAGYQATQSNRLMEQYIISSNRNMKHKIQKQIHANMDTR